MKYAGSEIETYLYSTLGPTINDGSNTWAFYTNPPKTPVEVDKYVWTGLTLIDENGSKDKFLSEFLLELTIVDRSNVNYSTNLDADTCANYLTSQLFVKGRQITLPSYNLTRVTLSAVEPTLEYQGQDTLIVRKLIFSILAQEL